MLIIGHDLINYQEITEITKLHQIDNFDNILFKFSQNKIKAAKELNKTFSIKVGNVEEILISNSCGAKFIIVDMNLAKKAQKIANYYIFDSKIAVIINSESLLEKLADLGVDAAIFEKGIKYAKN